MKMRDSSWNLTLLGIPATLLFMNLGFDPSVLFSAFHTTVVIVKGSCLVGRRDFREFFVENLIYIFHNCLLILKVHIFSNSQ